MLLKRLQKNAVLKFRPFFKSTAKSPDNRNKKTNQMVNIDWRNIIKQTKNKNKNKNINTNKTKTKFFIIEELFPKGLNPMAAFCHI